MDETTAKLTTLENLQQAMERVKTEIDSIDVSALSGYEVATLEETEAMLDDVFGAAEEEG